MGVPAFFRWLSEKYPKSITPVHDGEVASQDTGAECDHLYVDMNGVIHPCAHPEDRELPCGDSFKVFVMSKFCLLLESNPSWEKTARRSAPESEAMMFSDLLAYMDRLVGVTRPTTVIYLAIDGVAPRAKMNQQRARRWKAAREAQEKKELEDAVRAELTGAAKGPAPADAWDSNVITPGTPFMQRLSTYVRHGVAMRQQGDCPDCAPEAAPYWKKCAVIISDATVPGEGEHKIMAFVRNLRHVEGYNPNTRHVLHGLDADLIMLALATHEASFSILREEVLFGRAARQAEEDHARERAAADALAGGPKGSNKSWVYNKRLQLLRVATLREYLEVEFASIDHALRKRNAALASQAAGKARQFAFDFERVIDDFVFLCFFVGNDFLPHLPSLDIREGALDMLLNVYKTALPRLGGYVTSDGGFIDTGRLGKLLCDVGRVEDEIFQRRRRSEEDDKQRRTRDREAKKRAEEGLRAHGAAHAVTPRDAANASAAKAIKNALLPTRGESTPLSEEESAAASASEGTSGAKNGHRGTPKETKDASVSPEAVEESVARILAEKRAAKLDRCSETVVDEVRLGDAGWKERYYGSEFKKRDIALNGGKRRLLEEYVLGLSWVLRYYYEGCVSWAWFFPFHYAPFASDLAEILCSPEATAEGSRLGSNDPFAADTSGPFTPLQQLMAVLPAASAHALPPKCQDLMCSPDSELKEFYSDDVDIDPNGKAMPWLHVVLLPFVDVQKLVATLAKHEPLYDPTDADLVEANTRTEALVYVRADHDLAALVAQPEAAAARGPQPRFLAGSLERPPQGNRRIDLGARVPKPPDAARLHDIAASAVASATLKDPLRAKHVSKLLAGAETTRGVLDARDRQQPRPPPRLGRRGTPQVAELGLEGHNDDLRLAAQRGVASPAMAALLQPKRSWSQMNADLLWRDDMDRNRDLSLRREWGSQEPRSLKKPVHHHFHHHHHQAPAPQYGGPGGGPHHHPLLARYPPEPFVDPFHRPHPLLHGGPPVPFGGGGGGRGGNIPVAAPPHHAFGHLPPPPPPHHGDPRRPLYSFHAPPPPTARHQGAHHGQAPFHHHQAPPYAHSAPPPLAASRPPPTSDFLQAQLAKALQQRRQQTPQQPRPPHY